MKKNSKIAFIVLPIIVIIILLTFVYEKMIKNSEIGNNMNSQEIVDYILNITSYKSNVTIHINSNKNKNNYVLEQEYNIEQGSMQKVLQPENIAGVKIVKKDGNITIENTNLNLSTIFENYESLEENSLDLISFIEDYKNYEKSNFQQNNTEIIMKTKRDNLNKYIDNKILYIDKQTKKPTKLIIEDNNKNTTINIQYNEIELN